MSNKLRFFLHIAMSLFSMTTHCCRAQRFDGF